MAAKGRIKALKLGTAEEFLIFKRYLLNRGSSGSCTLSYF